MEPCHSSIRQSHLLSPSRYSSLSLSTILFTYLPSISLFIALHLYTTYYFPLPLLNYLHPLFHAVSGLPINRSEIPLQIFPNTIRTKTSTSGMSINFSTFKHLYLVSNCSANHGLSSMVLLFLLLLLSPTIPPAGAQPGSPQGSDSSDGNYYNPKFSPSIGVIIIVLVAALFFMGFFSIYIRHCAEGPSAGGQNPMPGTRGRSRRGPRGLDAAVIEGFPTFAYSDIKSLKVGKGALECAVCLNHFEDEDSLRLIPKCDHVFHIDCIDPWLVAHTTCPVCRADLVPGACEWTQDSADLDQINEHSPSNHEVVVEVDQRCEDRDGDNMERPLHAPEVGRLNRNRTRRNMSGRPRWFDRFSRSNSTGHVEVKQWENHDRFTLRLPEEVRRQIMSGKLKRSASLVVLPREGSSRRGYRGGDGEGSSRGRLDGAGSRSDRWVFSLAPPFFTRAPSTKSPKVAASGGGSLHKSNSTKAATFAESVNAAKFDDTAVNAAVESAGVPV
ncbi:hypothetical protein Ancab_000778 [Ancistrocladus abbreviatus]